MMLIYKYVPQLPSKIEESAAEYKRSLEFSPIELHTHNQSECTLWCSVWYSNDFTLLLLTLFDYENVKYI